MPSGLVELAVNNADPQFVAEQARRAIAANPHDAESYRQLGAALRQAGDDEAAAEAEMGAIFASQHDPALQRAAAALMSGNLPAAEATLRPVLAARPHDVAALRMLADVALRLGRLREAEQLLRRALDLAPTFDFARYNLATALHLQNRSGEALAELDRLRGNDTEESLSMRAAIYSRIGRYKEAASLYRDLASRHSERVEIWISLANVLKFAGDQEGAVSSYRRAIEVLPEHGEAWWGLADLKTYKFTTEDIAAMQAALQRTDLNDDDRLRLHFALGKAFEDLGENELSFTHYAKGNSLRAGQIQYDPALVTKLVAATEATLTEALLQRRGQDGCKARDPIFVVGMPRAGSTLVEQILASHSLVEGTAELPDIIILARDLEKAEGKFSAQPWERYPAIIADLSPGDLEDLGALYIERTRIQRQTDRPFFTDKMPNNWVHVGLIRLILPNAKIVDVRRHPLACGFSNFKQHYARGQEFSYDMAHFGSYYRDYLRLMRHFDSVAPGAVHRVIYERLVKDPRAEVIRLLDFIGVPFEESCLRFHDTKRVVRTASAEQVRRPINSSGVDQWRRFDKWLGPLKEALGPALDDWRD